MASEDWADGFVKTTYRYMRVSRKTGKETGRITCLKDGAVTRNDDTRIKESAEATMLEDYDFGADFVRIYIEVETFAGKKLTDCLGTFLPVVPSRTVNGMIAKSTLKLYGRLQEFLDDKFGTPYTVAKGANAVAVVKKVCEDMGFEVIAESSDYTVSDSRYYGVGAKQNNSETGDTKLDMINDLLDLAGFRGIYTDRMGRVVLEKYRDLNSTAPTWSFVEGANARFERSVTDEWDYTSTANHVVVRYSSTESNQAVVGEAWDNDPNSPLSTVSRGRTITSSYTYEELPPGKTDTAKKEYANTRAQSLLNTAQSTIHRITFTCAYTPLAINDAIYFSYPTGDLQGKFSIRTITLKLSGGCPTTIEARRYTRG